MIDREKMINALKDIADYFQAYRENVMMHPSEDRRFAIYIEAAEDAAELLKEQEQEEDPCENCQEFTCDNCKIWEEKMINALHDIADYFRLCRKNAASSGAAARRFEIYVEAAEDAAELLKAQEPLEMTLEEAHAKLEKYGIPKYHLYSYAVGGGEGG